MPISHTLSKRLRSDSNQDAGPSRTFSSRSGKQMNMGEISLPVNLLSTTNMLSYEAPDISVAQQKLRINPQSIPRAPRESQAAKSSTSTEPSLTDGSSVESSPTVEYNHLSTYFPGPAVARTKSARKALEADESVPALPQRAPSHSKREHERLASKRSLRSTRSTTSLTPSSPNGDRTSFDIVGNTGSRQGFSPAASGSNLSTVSPPPPTNHHMPHHPFSSELEQLHEVAETFTDVTRSLEEDEDTLIMRQKGLAKFTVVDYLSEISSLFPRAPFQAGFERGDNEGGWI